MKQLLNTFTFLILSSSALMAQSVAICGWDGVGGTNTAGDEFSFVLLRDYAAGEVIYFTEDEYNLGTTNFDSDEGHIAYTVPAGGLLVNEVVKILDTGNDIFSVQCAGGTAVKVAGSGNWSFSNSDEIYAYSASNPTSPWSSIIDIYCFIYGSVIAPQANQIPPAATYPTMIYIAVNQGASGSMAANFNDVSRANTTRAMLENSANWTKSTGDITLSCTDFTNHMLPVELISFNAEKTGKNVRISWETAAEVNNEKFEVEHSTTSDRFVKIGETSGYGSSNRDHQYSFIHAGASTGQNYYRLKQIDFDGSYEYSPIASVNLTSSETVNNYYPNPTTDGLINLEYSAKNNSLMEFSINNLAGSIVSNQNRAVVRGSNRINLDLSDLKAGVYIIEAKNETTYFSKKLVIK